MIESIKRLSKETEVDSVQKVVARITAKMQQSKLSDLQPPYLPKTLTRYRFDHYNQLKKSINPLLGPQATQAEFVKGIKLLRQFIVGLDEEYFSIYLEQVRGSYVKKIFQDNYQFESINFKDINSKYKLGNEINLLLSATSEWLIQIEATQDLLERAELYFGIKVPEVLEKTRKEGTDSKESSWLYSFLNTGREISAFALRRSSKLIQSTLFATMAPAAAMLTLAIMGGTSTFPWQHNSVNMKTLMAPLLAATVPYFMETLANSLERGKFATTLTQWTQTFTHLSVGVTKFNQEMGISIRSCYQANSYNPFMKEITNIQKFVQIIRTNIRNLNEIPANKFEEIRQRTEAYFKVYSETTDGQWTIVVPKQQKMGKTTN